MVTLANMGSRWQGGKHVSADVRHSNFGMRSTALGSRHNAPAL